MTYRFYVPFNISEVEARDKLQKYGVQPGKYFWFWTGNTGWGFFTTCRILDHYKAYRLWREYIWVAEDPDYRQKVFWLGIPEWE